MKAERGSSQPLGDWQKVLWLVAATGEQVFQGREGIRHACCALFEWDRERFELAYGELERRRRERQE